MSCGVLLSLGLVTLTLRFKGQLLLTTTMNVKCHQQCNVQFCSRPRTVSLRDIIIFSFCVNLGVPYAVIIKYGIDNLRQFWTISGV